MTIWRMHIAYLMPKSINTQRGCVIIVAFLLQQWLCERGYCSAMLTLPVFSLLQAAYYKNADSLLQLLVMPSMVAIVKVFVLVDLQTKRPNDLSVGLYYALLLTYLLHGAESFLSS